MEKVRLDVLSLAPSPLCEDVFTLLLGETAGPRYLPMLLGTLEAQAIALALRFAAALYIYEPLLDEAYLLMAPSQPVPLVSARAATPGNSQSFSTKHLQDYSVTALKKILQQVVAQEDYEQACFTQRRN